MRLAALLVSLLGLYSCGASVPAKVFVEPGPSPASLTTYPAVPMVHTNIRLICRLPSDVGEGRYTFGVAGEFSSEGPIEHIEYSRIMVAPCEPVTAFCGYQENGKKPVMLTLNVQGTGDCGGSK